MRHIDVFNGDADGICALTQIRNAHRVESTLVTGVIVILAVWLDMKTRRRTQ